MAMNLDDTLDFLKVEVIDDDTSAINQFSVPSTSSEYILPDLPNGFSNLPNGVSNLPNGLSNLPNGLSILPNSVSNLPSGVSILPNGLSNLPNGLSNLSTDSSQSIGSYMTSELSIGDQNLLFSDFDFKRLIDFPTQQGNIASQDLFQAALPARQQDVHPTYSSLHSSPSLPSTSWVNMPSTSSHFTPYYTIPSHPRPPPQMHDFGVQTSPPGQNEIVYMHYPNQHLLPAIFPSHQLLSSHNLTATQEHAPIQFQSFGFTANPEAAPTATLHSTSYSFSEATNGASVPQRSPEVMPISYQSAILPRPNTGARARRRPNNSRSSPPAEPSTSQASCSGVAQNSPSSRRRERRASRTTARNRSSGIESNVCDLCGVRTASSGHKKRHQESHGCDRRFKCNINTCDVAYSRKDNLKKHLNNAHQDEKEKKPNSDYRSEQRAG